MNETDRQARMMDYLYGEMSDAQAREYEQWLARHPEVQQELATLRDSRRLLAEVEDRHPQPLLVELPEKKTIARPWWYRGAAAAAVLLALWLFNFQVRADGGGVVLSFGHPQNTAPAESSTAPLQETIPAAVWEQWLTDHQESLAAKFSSLDSTWQQRFAGLQADNRRQWRSVRADQSDQLQRIRREFAEEELPQLAGLLQQLQLEQQAELQLLLVEFWNTWQETRQTDLQQIDYQMSSLYQNVERNQQASEARVVNYIEQVAGR